MLSPPSFIPPPLNLCNRLVDYCGVVKKEVLLEEAVDMEAEMEELNDLLVRIVCKKIMMNWVSTLAPPVFYWVGQMGNATMITIQEAMMMPSNFIHPYPPIITISLRR
jgi:hypothetical protein